VAISIVRFIKARPLPFLTEPLALNTLPSTWNNEFSKQTDSVHGPGFICCSQNTDRVHRQLKKVTDYPFISLKGH
jgi:hypothetical protein